MMITHSLVDPSGNIVRRRERLGPHMPALVGGFRWVPDATPAIDDELQLATPIEPVPADAAAIGYAITWRPIDQVRAVVLERINADYELAVASIRAGYPPSEVLSWDKQEAEARAVQADPLAASPFIDGLAAARGIAKAELVTRIIQKANAFATAVATLTGRRQSLEDQLDAAPTAAAVALIHW